MSESRAGDPRFTLTIRCHRCRRESETVRSDSLDTIGRLLIRAGWTVNEQREWICAVCASVPCAS